MDDIDRLPLPPRLLTTDDRMRRIGVEAELTGLELSEIAETVQGLFGGHLQETSPYELEVRETEFGDFHIELDFHYLKEKGRSNEADSVFSELSEEMLRVLSEGLVPFEVVAPPMPMDRLGEFDRLIAELRRRGAQGTFHGVLNAFGLQFNPELPALAAGDILAYMRGFFCLHDWLKENGRVDFTRRLTPYVSPFPKEYLIRVLDPAYRPGLAGLIDDYLAANPTRNRALDMLPLFSYLDPRRVSARLDDPRINARPTLHYRLPNCEIDRPGWGVHQAWRDWLQVEYLAADHSRLSAMSEAYLGHLATPWYNYQPEWCDETPQWLIDIVP